MRFSFENFFSFTILCSFAMLNCRRKLLHQWICSDKSLHDSLLLEFLVWSLGSSGRQMFPCGWQIKKLKIWLWGLKISFMKYKFFQLDSIFFNLPIFDFGLMTIAEFKHRCRHLRSLCSIDNLSIGSLANETSS